MAADDLHFPSSDALDDPHAAFTASQLGASYAATPEHDAAHIEMVTRAVLAKATAAPSHDVVLPVAGRPTRRWWWSAAAAAALVVVFTRPWRQPQVPVLPPAGSAPIDVPTIAGRIEEQDGTVRFEFTLPDTVQAVALVGDFNGWDTDATPMVRTRTGTWSARVPLEPGRHEYAFVIDGQRWVVDPLAPQVPDAGFGPTNAVVVEAEGAP